MTTTKQMAGEILFESYLRERGIEVPPHEPDLGVSTRPDYVVEHRGTICVCEVEEFAPTTNSLPGGAHGSRGGSFSMEAVLKPIRGKIREAARQLKPLAGSGLPLAVVIANPHKAPVIMGDQEMVWAMYGDPVVRLRVAQSTGVASDVAFTADRNGKLTGDHQYISAVVVLRERSRAADTFDEICARYTTTDDKLRAMNAASAAGTVPTGDYIVVDAFKTASLTATPLPDGLFDGARDRVFEFDPRLGAIVQIHGA